MHRHLVTATGMASAGAAGTSLPSIIYAVQAEMEGSLTIYAWTNSKPGRQDIRKVTNLAELCNHLSVLDLPGVAPPEFVSVHTDVPDHGAYTYNEGSADEWSLTWTKVDGSTEVIDQSS